MNGGIISFPPGLHGTASGVRRLPAGKPCREQRNRPPTLGDRRPAHEQRTTGFQPVRDEFGGCHTLQKFRSGHHEQRHPADVWITELLLHRPGENHESLAGLLLVPAQRFTGPSGNSAATPALTAQNAPSVFANAPVGYPSASLATSTIRRACPPPAAAMSPPAAAAGARCGSASTTTG